MQAVNAETGELEWVAVGRGTEAGSCPSNHAALKAAGLLSSRCKPVQTALKMRPLRSCCAPLCTWTCCTTTLATAHMRLPSRTQSERAGAADQSWISGRARGCWRCRECGTPQPVVHTHLDASDLHPSSPRCDHRAASPSTLQAGVFACETFGPMAQLARRVVAAQGCAAAQDITVVAKRSDELSSAPFRLWTKHEAHAVSPQAGLLEP